MIVLARIKVFDTTAKKWVYADKSLGKSGKSAYDYAKEGGYTGTETEFAAKLAAPFVTPQMYGAKADGSTDDTAAFQAALSTNNNVFVPEGSYLITEPLDLTYKKSLYSNDGQRATIFYRGSDSIINLGRLSVFRNINIRIKNAFVGTVFNTNNSAMNVTTSQAAMESIVEHTNVYFEIASPEAILIGIRMDSGTDPNNKPKVTAVCYQKYHDINVEYGCKTYGCGIKMELIQNRAFTEDNKEGFPWITHIDYDDIFLGGPYTAIKAGVTVAEGIEHFERVNMGNILFNNVSTQYRDADSTRYFLDLNNFNGFFTKMMAWDYHPLTWNGKKVNIIGENVTASFSNCQMAFGDDFLRCCEFTAESDYTVDKNPEYFVNKYFPGTVLSQGYDGIDAKISSKLSSEFVANVAEEKINDILYSGYINVMKDPLTQIRHYQRWSSSGNGWKDQTPTNEDKKTTVIIPALPGGNIIRWTPDTVHCNSGSYQEIYFFNNDDLTDGLAYSSFVKAWDAENKCLKIENPSGYKYISIPFDYNINITPEKVVMTINREITGNEAKSYTEYLRESVINPAIQEEVKNIDSGVSSVNEKTGHVQLTADDVGAPSILEVAKYITPEMYGAKGDGKTDDSAAIQAAIDAAGRSATIYLGKKEYKISTGITITKNRAHFVCDGILKYDGTEAALKLESIALCDINVYAIEAPNGTAVLLDSTNGEVGGSTICVKHVIESRIGLHLKGSLGGAPAGGGHNIFYNKITMEGTIYSTDTCVFIEAIDALVSENIFRLGRLYGGALYGIRIHCNDTDGGDQVVGHGARNMFYGGNFEGLSDDGCSIYMHNTSHNTFVNWRVFEAYGKYTVVFSGECEANDVGLSRVALTEIDTTNLTGTGVYKNILRSPCIVGGNMNNLSGLNKIWLSFEDGFTSEYSNIEKMLHTETWIFTLSDGTVIEKQVNAT